MALEGDAVIGTLAIMNKGDGNGIIKKGFVKKEYRKRGILSQLYERLTEFAKREGFARLMFDTPSVAKDCHQFFEKRGYARISKDEMPFAYEYPDRDSYLYLFCLN